MNEHPRSPSPELSSSRLASSIRVRAVATWLTILLAIACPATATEQDSESYWASLSPSGTKLKLDGVVPSMVASIVSEKYKLPVSGETLVAALESFGNLFENSYGGSVVLYADRFVFEPEMGASLVSSTSIRREWKYCDISGVGFISSNWSGDAVVFSDSSSFVYKFRHSNPFSLYDKAYEIRDKILSRIQKNCGHRRS